MKEKLIVPEFIESRQPTHVGWVPNPDEFSEQLLTTLRTSSTSMFRINPLMFGPSSDPSLPQFAATFKIIIDHYTEHILERDSTVGSFTVDQSLNQRRISRPHTDGTEDKSVIYSVSDVNPTIFYVQTAKMRSRNKHAFIDLKEECVWRPEPYEIVRFDGCTIHKSPPAVHTLRTFIRVAFYP